MAIYNVEPFLREAIDSVIEQDIGFENIQLILVDDGSPDGSGAICDEYAQRYPENVEVIHKENGGSSSARNAGIPRAKGKYLSFFDPDDYLDLNTFSSVYNFFELHGNTVDVVAIPIVMFGTQTGEHPLNIKFKQGTRVIDLEKEWMYPQLSLATSFYRTSAAREYAFDVDLDLVAGEDAHEIIRILSHKPKLGVVSDVWYHYRRREDSLISGSQKKKAWYTENLIDLHFFAIDYCKKNIGYIPKNIQYTLMYDLQWKLLQIERIPEVLTQEEYEVYQQTLFSLFQYFDDDVILQQRNIFTEHKSLALAKKYGYLPKQIQWKNDSLYYYNDCACFAASQLAVHMQFAEIKDDSIVLEGWYPHYLFLDEDIPQLIANVNGIPHPCQAIPYERIRKAVGTDVYRQVGFRVAIPLHRDSKRISIQLRRKTHSGNVPLTNLILSNYFPVCKEYRNAFYTSHGWIFTFRNGVFVLSQGNGTAFAHEMRFLKEAWKKNLRGGRKAVIARLLYHISKPFVRKKIWLIADKANRADDNGEAFFKYCCQHKRSDIHPIFLVAKDSSDFKRLQKIGTVIPYMSWRHKLLYLHADKMISAYSHMELSNPFYEHANLYQDIMQNCKFVFLQHGVIHTDISPVLNRMTKNYRGFITSAPLENAFIVETCNYSQEQVWLTGLPRHDYLYNTPEKSIVFMPTWRRALFGQYHAEDTRYDLKPGFENSDYYQFFNKIFASERLLEAARQYGYSIRFVPHPVFFPYVDRFNTPNYIQVCDEHTVYRDIFAQSSLLITDYSSVAFDFSYLRKPIIYTQSIPLEHYGKGYFDYERDGFGEVEYTLEGTIDRIIEYMENGCTLKEEYRQRIDKFFAFNDQNNCQRVYEKLMEMDGRNTSL